MDANEIAIRYESDGYCFPIQAMTEAEAGAYRDMLERQAGERDDPVEKAILFSHADMVLPFVDEISRRPSIVEPVKAVLGPDLLVWGANFFIKEPGTTDFVSWHQDLTYWDLNDAAEVTAWVALSPATRESGCMRFVPGSHLGGIVDHRDTFAGENMLSRGQEIAVEVDEKEAIDVILQPGQMSLHHGRLFHGSRANRSEDRRIGLAIRYITPAMRQSSGVKTFVHLVAGEDRYGHFELLPAAIRDPDRCGHGTGPPCRRDGGEISLCRSRGAGQTPDLSRLTKQCGQFARFTSPRGMTTSGEPSADPVKWPAVHVEKVHHVDNDECFCGGGPATRVAGRTAPKPHQQPERK